METTLIHLVEIGISWGLAAILLGVLERHLRTLGMARPNFQKIPIPTGMGLIWVLAGSLVMGCSALLSETDRWKNITFLIALLGFGGLGWLDDRRGTRQVGGFKGHIRQLLHHKQITTGLIKALGGGILGLTLGAMVESCPLPALLNGLLIALSANALNLLDVRPGRAIKGFAGMSLLLPGGGSIKALQEIGIVAGAVIAYLPRELRCKAMMGDTGSNSLGAMMGLAMAWYLPPSWKWGILIGLIALHGITEAYSLTRLIEGNRVLRWVDRLGVRKSDGT